MENVIISVEPVPEQDLLDEMEVDDLFGVYIGTPLTERSFGDPYMLPDQILIFQEPLEAACESEEELQEEIRVTLIHEVGHFFGLSEDEIEQTLEEPHWARKEARRSASKAET